MRILGEVHGLSRPEARICQIEGQLRCTVLHMRFLVRNFIYQLLEWVDLTMNLPSLTVDNSC